MSKRISSFLAMICVVVILVSLMATTALAADVSEEENAQEPIILAYTDIPLYVDDEFIGTGFMMDSITYIPMLAFCEAMLMTDFDWDWDQDEASVVLSAEDIEISFTLSDNYIVANGRYIYLQNQAYNINGTIMVPIRELAKIFNVNVEWDEEDWCVDIDTSEVEILQSGDEFYDAYSLKWLSRVISAEAGAEPIEGMIGVGNVVLNRVNDESDAFSNTIKGVIFQPGQFAVAESGAVYLDPNERAIVAAKLCLEGYNTVGDSLYFLNPEMSSTKWFDKYKTYVTSIENHDFYA